MPGEADLVWRRLIAARTAPLRSPRYHEERNHQGKDNVLLFPLPTRAVRGEQEEVRCRERLGGLLKFYEREAA